MDHHTLAGISISGSCLDVLGSLYLAYDLLGGQRGPLRFMTRAVTYSVVFGIGYGLGFGVFFGIASGLATGVTIAIELGRSTRGEDHFPLTWEAFFSMIRAAGFVVGLYRIVGPRFALAFGLLITLGQIFAYAQGVRPALANNASRRPRLTRIMIWGSVVRTFGYLISALVCSALVQHVDHPLQFGLRLGVITGIVTTVGMICTPFIEHFADHLPERIMGAFGICLIFLGFGLQSVQYWLSLLDVPVR